MQWKMLWLHKPEKKRVVKIFEQIFSSNNDKVYAKWSYSRNLYMFKPVSIIEIDNIHMKCGFKDGCIVKRSNTTRFMNFCIR